MENTTAGSNKACIKMRNSELCRSKFTHQLIWTPETFNTYRLLIDYIDCTFISCAGNISHLSHPATQTIKYPHKLD